MLKLMPTLIALRAKLKAKHGFTLIELLVVISIIAILITIIVATFGTTQEKARDSRRKTDLDALKKSLELAKGDRPGSAWYPNCNTGNKCPLADHTTFEPDLDTGYLRNFPLDPSGVYTYETSSITGHTIKCETGGGIPPVPSDGDPGCDGYRIIACLENFNDGDQDADASGDPNPYPDCVDPVTGEGASYTIFNP
jgi:prepilin-type N-terminal cleavage/methylation domain-containing protein